MTLKIALAQIGCVPDDPDGTLDRAIAACREAAACKADIVLLPEATVQGPCPDGPPERLRAALADWPDLAVVLGCRGGGSVLLGGRELARLHDGSDEPRRVALPGVTVAIVFPDEFFALAEGIAGVAPIETSVAVLAPRLAGAELLLTPAAWPAFIDELDSCERVPAEVAARLRLPLLCANAVGGDDRLRFAGASFALDAYGRQQVRLPLATPALALVELDPAGPADDRHLALRRGVVAPLLAPEAQWHRLLIAFLRERVRGTARLADDGDIGAAVLRALCAEAFDAGTVAARSIRHGEDGLPTDAADAADVAPTLLLPADRSSLAVGARPVPTARGDVSSGVGAAAAGAVVPRRLAPLGNLYRGEVIRLARWLMEQGLADIPRDLQLVARASLRDAGGSPLPPCDIVDAILTLELDASEPEGRIRAGGYEPDVIDRLLAAVRRIDAQGSDVIVIPRWRRCQLAGMKEG